jgi:hypothetical protein
MPWIRGSSAPVRAATFVNVERVATEYRVFSLGEKSAYVPSDKGGTGQRVNVEMWALQVRGATGTTSWTDLEWAWGTSDDVVPYLNARMREEQARNDIKLLGAFGYTPSFTMPDSW